MKCSACQTENPEGKKFCRKCGTILSIRCPDCNSAVAPGDEFCGDCGANLKKTAESPPLDLTQPHSYTPKFLADKILTTRSSIEGERKVVTVLFADVANYTSLSEKLDPEEVHELMDGCFRILMDEIHRCEGTINQFIGDGVMALFGAPVAHEDHARRACHAALAVQRDFAVYGQKIERDIGLPFKMRIGLNSGAVIIGAIGDDLRMDYTAVGDTTNLAARMQSLAQPGSILVTNDTYRLARDYFTFESLGKLTVKGKDEPQEAYALLRPSEVETRIEASVARGLTRFVGREAEVALLEKAFGRAASGSGQIVGIVGEAGVGKSRLILELRTMLPPSSYTYLEGRCLHYGGSMPYLPILDLLRGYFAVKEGEREFVIRKSVKESALALNETLSHVLVPIEDLLSLKVEDEEYLKLEPQAKREKTFEALRDLIVRISEDKPLIIAIEDLHWIDRTSHEFLDYLIGWLANTRILLVLLYRPEFSHAWTSRSYYTQIGVDQLALGPSAELVRYILAGGDVAPEIRDLILKRTAGNPLFMEEFTQSLLENGAIEKKDHQYVLTRQASEIQVPESIQGIIAARIDRLQENLKRTMQVAAVIGRDFAFRILQTITGMREDLKTQLMNLQGLEFIYEKQLFPELEYIFKHILTQEVAYNSLLARRRTEIHEKIGRAIETIYAERIEDFYEMLAYHYGKGETFEKAAHYFKLSGNKAIAKHTQWEAFHFYREAVRALARLPASDENKRLQIDVILSMMIPMISLGHPEGSLEMLQVGVRLAQEMGDERSLMIFYGRLAILNVHSSEPLLSLDYAEKAYQASKKVRDVELFCSAAMGLTAAYTSIGDYRKVFDICSEGMTILEEEKRQLDYCGAPFPPYPLACAYAGEALAFLGDFECGDSLYKKGIDSATESGNLQALAMIENSYGIFFNLQGAGKPAIRQIEKSIAHCEQTGLTILTLYNWACLGWAYYALGAMDTADKSISKAAEIQAIVGADFSFSLSFFIYYCWSMVHLALHKGPRAFELIEESVRLAKKNSERHFEGLAHVGWGKIVSSIYPSRRSEARNSIREGISILRELKIKPWYTQGYLWLGELDAADGEHEKSVKNVRIAEENFRAMGMEWWLARTEAVHAYLWKREGNRAKAKKSLRAAIDLFRECGSDGWVKKYEKELDRL